MMLPRTSATPSLKARALRLLAAREYTQAELRERLAPHAISEALLDQTLDELRQKGLLSDARAAESLVHRHQARHGSARIVREMQRRGLPDELIEQAAQALEHTEQERAWNVWLQKFGHLPLNAQEQARQMRFLLSRGFRPGVFQQVLRMARQMPDTSSGG